MVNGLTNKEVIEQRKKYGSNEISRKKQKSIIKLFLESLADPIIKILLIALGIKTVFLFHDFDWFETLGIVIAILIASLISTLSEYGSEEAFKKLQEESLKLKCKVKRESKIQQVPIDEVVVKDIVLLQTGDKIPADGIIKEGSVLVDESSMNGEAKEVEKRLGEKVYRGTVIYAEEAYMEVTEVGDKTFYGKMSKELQESGQESPLKIRLRELAKFISKIGYVSAILVAISYLFTEIIVANSFNMQKVLESIMNFPELMNHLIYALTLSVTIIVVAVPEGLPMMITLVLSSNMKRMLKNNVLVRKLVGIETAGSLNILFTDKTGTITKGKLEVVGFLDGSLTEYKREEEVEKHKFLHEHLKNNCLYNNGSYLDENKKPVGGNITDRAILEFIHTDKRKKYHKLKTIPFDSKNKYSGAIIDIGEKINYIKGAPEKLLPICKSYVTKSGRKEPLVNKIAIEQEIKKRTQEGIRVILLAYNDNYNLERLERLTLIGILYIKDDIRKESPKGISIVQNAGIQTVMITGDNKETAISIAKEVGLITSNNDIILTSEELNNKSDEEIKKILPNLKVVARSMPQDKSRLVRIAEEENLVVGMTGDGVNDAPALKKADVGFAMGSGTEVAKEASDIVIMDDNLLSIAYAVLYGRTIFKSIRKFIIFQLTINLCAISLSIIGPFIGIESPVTVIQMLWINMIMDTLAGIAFSYEAPLKSYMEENPKPKDEKIMNSYMYSEILFTGIYSSALCIFFLKSPWIESIYRINETNKYLMTAFFALFIFMGIFNCFNARTPRLNLLSNLNKNKVFIIIILFIIIVQLYLIYYGGDLFRAYGLSVKELIFTILLAATVIPVDWVRKLVTKRKRIV
ncbi:MAG TPA: calcium-translocating P-type ATPase, PMCA-type [Candidatus Faecimonas gallistercoris]|nr:calcium-translocating P-type ATPase, PMCA-type [Candidatus Faecimonas gallistercoris]